MLRQTCDARVARGAAASSNRGGNTSSDLRSVASRVPTRVYSSLDCWDGRGGETRHSCLGTTPAYQQRSGSRLRSEQVRNFIQAGWYAIGIGLPLNRFITINWEAAGVTDAVRATGRFIKLARDWLRRRGSSSAHAWVQEYGSIVGQHAHILIHISPELVRAFSYRQRRWLTACGATFQRGIVRSRPVGRSYRHAFFGTQYGETYESHLSAITQYVLKEAEEQTKLRFGMSATGRGGAVYGKRIATSQNIGSQAQRGATATTPAPLQHRPSRANPKPRPREIIRSSRPNPMERRSL